MVEHLSLVEGNDRDSEVCGSDRSVLVLLADQAGVHEIDCLGKVGFPFFGQLILDSLNGTERAMTQAHIFKAAELSMLAAARGRAEWLS